jgi:TetR/AcrR family transcriptional repressor of bet genes
MDEMSEAKVRVRQNRKPSRIAAERKQDLIEAAIRDITAQGYDAVTVATICEEAGFSRGLIGHYFSGKDELLLEAVKEVADRLGQAIRGKVQAAGNDPVDRLHALIDASFSSPGQTKENVAVWVALTGAARLSPYLGAIYREIWRAYRAEVGELFKRAAKQKGLKLDPACTALTFSQLVEGLWVGGAADPESISQKSAAACCHAYVEQVLKI